jgi:hypothetical protein
MALAAIAAAGFAGAQEASPGAWSHFRDYTFVAEGALIAFADRRIAREVADFVGGGVSRQVALEGWDSARLASVREALVDAGIADSRIRIGSFGDPKLRRAHRVAVFVAN